MEIVSCEDCGGCLLHRSSKAQIAELSRLINPIIYKKGELIFQQGAPVLGFHIIGQGKVKLFRRFKDGRKRLIKVAQEGDILDMAALQGSERRSTFAEALTECQICFISKEDFFFWIERYPAAAIDLILKLSQEIHWLQVELSRYLLLWGLERD